MSDNVLQDLEAAAAAKVKAVEDKIKQWWTTEEPIIVGEVESWAEQVMGIAANSVVTVLEEVATGKITNKESFGKAVTTTYQTGIATGLNLTIVDAQQAVAQATKSAKQLVQPTS